MNVVQRAQEGYSGVVRSDRSVEYQTIARVSHRLRQAALKRSSDFPTYVSALHDNQKLWLALASDVAHPDNELPSELRAGIFYLAEFTEHETRRLMRGEGDVAALIDINAAVLMGLRAGEGKE